MAKTNVNAEQIRNELSDADVASDAAIAGSKISPDFGAQSLATTGSGSLGSASIEQSIQIKNAGGTTSVDGYVWTATDALGNGDWELNPGSPAGSNIQVQYNNNGAFGASSNFTWSGAILTLAGGAPELKVDSSANANIYLDRGAVSSESSLNFSLNSSIQWRAKVAATSGDFNIWREGGGADLGISTAGLVTIANSIKIANAGGTTPVDGYVWTATDTLGNGDWELATGGSGEVNTASNLGVTTYGLATTKNVSELPFKSLIAGTNVTMSASATEVTINAADGGETNTASNLGTTTYGLVTTKSGSNLPFKSLIAGTNVTLAQDANTVTINAASGGGGTPGGTDTQMQYNNGGAFGGTSNFLFNDANGNVSIGGAITSDKLKVVGTMYASERGRFGPNAGNGAGNLIEVGSSTDANIRMQGGHAGLLFDRGDGTKEAQLLFFTGSALNWRFKLGANRTGLEIFDQGGGQTRMYWATNGNVTVGSSISPNEKLAVEGRLSLLETSAPSATAGYGKIYVKAETPTRLYYMNDAGAETDLLASGGGGEVNTYSTLGTGTYSLVGTKNVSDLPFRELIAGTNVTLSQDATGVTINSSAGSGAAASLATSGAAVAISAAAPPTTGQVLEATSATTATWQTPAVGGGGTPGGTDTQMQYNNGGAFGGAANFLFNDANGNVSIGGAPTSDKLKVVGTMYASAQGRFGANAGTVASNLIEVGDSSNANIRMKGGNAGLLFERGTVSQEAQLLFFTGANLDWRLKMSTNRTGLEIFQGVGNPGAQTTVMYFAKGGNVSIGPSTTPAEKLDVQGRIKMLNQTAPATPTGGGVIYCEGGALKYKGTSGTITTLGAA